MLVILREKMPPFLSILLSFLELQKGLTRFRYLDRPLVCYKQCTEPTCKSRQSSFRD